MGFIKHFKEVGVIKSRKNFIEIKAMKLFVYLAFLFIPLKAPIPTYYCFSHPTPCNNVYSYSLRSQAISSLVYL